MTMMKLASGQNEKSLSSATWPGQVSAFFFNDKTLQKLLVATTQTLTISL